MVVRGANIARRRFPQLNFLLVGDEARLVKLLRRMKRLRRVVTIRHAEDVVTDDAKPSVALRSGRRTRMRLALAAVK